MIIVNTFAKVYKRQQYLYSCVAPSFSIDSNVKTWCVLPRPLPKSSLYRRSHIWVTRIDSHVKWLCFRNIDKFWPMSRVKKVWFQHQHEQLIPKISRLSYLDWFTHQVNLFPKYRSNWAMSKVKKVLFQHKQDQLVPKILRLSYSGQFTHQSDFVYRM